MLFDVFGFKKLYNSSMYLFNIISKVIDTLIFLARDFSILGYIGSESDELD
jgi:predicted HAD superfamily hydrolase